MIGRIISLIVAAGYMLIAYSYGGSLLVVKLLIYLVIGLACIWFGDEMGNLTGFSLTRMINVSEKTPGSFVRFVGWLVLILVPGIMIAIWLTR